MTKLLTRLFIKNHEDVSDPDVRENYGVMVSLVCVACNIILFLTKFIVGRLIGSVAITADSFNNLSDMGSSVITLVGFKMAGKPADAKHPFGHGRVEYISAFIVSFIILLFGWEFLKTSFSHILNPQPVGFSAVSIGILVLTVLVKVWMAGLNKKIGKKIDSQAMYATAQDSRNDVLVTSVTIASIVFTRLTNIVIDGFAGVFVAAVLLYGGYSIAKDVLSQLLGEAVTPESAREITQAVESYDGIFGTHDLIVHSYGPGHRLATLHAEVDMHVPITESHSLIDRIELEVGKALKLVLVIHMDPIDQADERIPAVRQAVTAYFEKEGLALSVHDIRMVDSKDIINIVFDLVVPHDFSGERREKVRNDLDAVITALDSRYRVIINIENSYIAEG